VRNLHKPVVEDVAREVEMSYSSDHLLPGLPYSEIPVICLVGGKCYFLLDDVLEYQFADDYRSFVIFE
jgi:hypothetical protein